MIAYLCESASSVADAIDFCREDLELPQFKRSEGTVKFIRLFDRPFDCLISRNLVAKGFKAPLRPGSAGFWTTFLKEAKEASDIGRGDKCPVVMATGTREAPSATPSSQVSALTITPSQYQTITNSRERIVVLVMSGLLLVISGSLFAILLSLISEDRACPKVSCPSLLVLNFIGSWLQQRVETRAIKTTNE
ncbi:hypothetical protein HPB52_000816 [Rhipicephalus sanguineus]|uniref:Transposable element P transposase-like GTP-binding insertion domain-containing protein n=1 Tax=Rhipicephalus sanguineus TaxID=34632 RepID=A0A9D4PUE1_RHISA|nr:hypothetical protein HPB52_000816 [Rhipicephalus sanguineus]